MPKSWKQRSQILSQILVNLWRGCKPKLIKRLIPRGCIRERTGGETPVGHHCPSFIPPNSYALGWSSGPIVWANCKVVN